MSADGNVLPHDISNHQGENMSTENYTMFRMLTKILPIVLAIGLSGVSLAIADVQAIKGKLQNIDMASGNFTLATTDSQQMQLKADAGLLEGLNAGELVIVTIDDKEIIAISPDTKSDD